MKPDRARPAAAEALRLASVEPRRARDLALGLLAEAGLGPGTRSVAMRAAGVADIQLRALPQAVEHLQAAVAAGRESGSRELAAQAQMSLASALVLRGQPRAAAAAIDDAVNHLDQPLRARARVQRAAIAQELGHVDAAMADLRRALPVLRRDGDAQWTVRALSNRSLLHVRQRAFRAAMADLTDADALSRQHALGLAGAYVAQNLGCLHAARGEVPAALDAFARAEALYRAEEMVVGSLSVDRAELLLAAGLLPEARAAATTAVEAYRSQRRLTHLPEALLLRSWVESEEGDYASAARSARDAELRLRRLGRQEWATLAAYARVRAIALGRTHEAGPATRSAVSLRRLSGPLARSGWPVSAMDAHILAARLEMGTLEDRSHRARAAALRRVREDLAGTASARRSGPVAERSRAWLAEALMRHAEGRHRSAISAAEAGLRLVERHRATLGATDLWAQAGAQAEPLVALGLTVAVDSKNPARVLQWAERARATALLAPPAAPPEDAELAEAMVDLRTTVAEIRDRRRAGDDSQPLLVRQIDLERRIRDRVRRSAPPRTIDGPERGLGRQLRASIDEQEALVELVEVGSRMHAIVLTRERSRVIEVGSRADILERSRRLGFALRRAAGPTRAPTGTATATKHWVGLLAAAADELDQSLTRPLGIDRPQVVVVPSPALHDVPWGLLPSMRTRALSVVPSARLWRRARRQAFPTARQGVVVAAGPGLQGAAREARAVASCYPGAVLLTGADATVEAVTRAAQNARVLHLAAHAEPRADNPLFSAIHLADGPLTVYDLEARVRTPAVVVLASCDSGRPAAVVGQELLGFAAALLSRGTTVVLAPVVPVADAETTTVMVALHAELTSGQGPAEALARTRQSLDAGQLPTEAAVAAAFVCLGDGRRVPPR